jgi:O-antigen ligase
MDRPGGRMIQGLNMSRRGARSSASSRGASASLAAKPTTPPEWFEEYSDDATTRYGEALRRLSLGLLTALVTCRFYWPSEPDPTTGSGSGLLWDLMMMAAAGLAIAGTLLGGRFRFRWSWADVAFVVLIGLVVVSAGRGLDRRSAMNLSWDWVGIGLAYILARWLPRSAAESRVLAGALMISAVAVSAYALYQARVEIPQLQERFRRNPQQVLLEAKVPNDPQRIETFRNRLLESNEVYATFALPNSLAGFLVGPLVVLIAVLLETVAAQRTAGSRWRLIACIAAPLLCLLVCLMLSKSMSAFIGMLTALAVLAWRMRRRLSRRQLIVTGLASAVLLTGLLGAGLASGRLNRLLLTQAQRSLRYRWEYWQGTWGVISEGAGTPSQVLRVPSFWSGVGPGNFGGHYLLYKLPEASEEIQDPHNLFLEVWATAGLWALLALVACLILAMWDLLGPSRGMPEGPTDRNPRREKVSRPDHRVSRETSARTDVLSAGPASGRLRWLWIAAGSGLLLVMIVGEMNLFQQDLLPRWLVLTAGWVIGALLLAAPWTRSPVSGSALGLGVLAVSVNLLAQGGIGFPGVALALWLMAALGLNLREDRGCSRPRELDSRIPGFALALGWAALAGSFAGQVLPFWKSQAALARADEALAHRPPEFERAESAYQAAIKADPLNVQAFIGEAYLHSLVWESRGARPNDERWRLIPSALMLAASPPRNPNTWTLHSERARVIREILSKVASALPPTKIIPLQASIVEATRTASRLYPTNAVLHARLAEASAEVSMFGDAVTEANEALRLDALTPHQDKKLPYAVRDRLVAALPEWTRKSAGSRQSEGPNRQ